MAKRTSMEPEARRRQLIECARDLFFERGYEATTVNDIIARAGVSKGGFYHHFAAKEDVLEGLCVLLAEQAMQRLRPLVESEGAPAVDRLNAMLSQSRRMKAADAPGLVATFATVFQPANLVLYYRLHRVLAEVTIPMLARILQAGREEGVFSIADAEVTAELILHLGTATHDAVARAIDARGTEHAAAAAQRLNERLRAQGHAIDRILGVPDGTVCFVEPGFAEALLSISV